MKIVYSLLVFPLFCLSQSPADRQKIVSTYDQQASERLKSEAAAYMAQQHQLIAQYKATHDVKESETHSLQRIVEGVPLFFSIDNEGSSKTIRANAMYPGGALNLNVTGDGIIAGIWDGGKVRNTHQEFPSNKVTLSDDASTLSAHATHVTGTVCAAGTSPTRKGIAYGATAFTHDWDNDYTEMLDFGSAGYLVSNHSYGYDTTNLPLWEFGAYDGSSIEVDNASYAYPYYQIVIAAGNDRGNPDIAQTSQYDLLSGTGTSKNGITVAAVEQLLNYSTPQSVVMSDFSNWGPTDDGRIKPDISAKGVNTSSCVSATDYSYDTYSGTSMAAPAITGLVALLQQHYHNVTGNYMRASTVRGLICHTAREAGADDGPDYSFGWGLADGLNAANTITNRGTKTIVDEKTLNAGETFSQDISILATQKLFVTICWTDPAGLPNSSSFPDNRSPRLRNNLDLKVFKDGNIYYPWKLDPDNPYAPATRDSDNDVDNVEKITIDSASPGVYTIQVTHKGTLLGGSQVFSLIASGGSPTGVTLATPDLAYADNIVLYPNPVGDLLNFSVPGDGTIEKAAIYDLLGNQVTSETSPVNNAIETSSLASGIYMVRFVHDGKNLVRKFIKR